MMDFAQVAVEKVQGYWNARPCNIRHSTQPVGTRQYFDEVEARKYRVEPHIPAFADFPAWNGKKVLEIGSGIGTAMIGFARAGAEVTAIDLSGTSLELARQRAQVYGLEERIRFYTGNAEELSTFVPAEAYDLIYSFGVIHHTPHPSRVLNELRQYVRPGSVVKIMVYYRYSWKVLWIILTEGKGQFWRAKELVAQNSEAQSGCPITYTYSRREMRDLLERRGFRVTEMQVEHIFPYRIKDYVQYRYVKEWYFRWLPPPVFRWLEQRLGWHLCVTAVAEPQSPQN